MLVVVTKIITYFGIQRSCAYIRAFCEVARSFKVQMLAVVVTWEGKSQLKFLSLAGLIRCSIFTSPRIVPYFEALPITEPFVTPPPLCFTRWWHSHRFQSQLAFPQHIYSGHLRVKLIILIKGGKCKERERDIYKGHLYPKFWGPIYQFLFSRRVLAFKWQDLKQHYFQFVKTKKTHGFPCIWLSWRRRKQNTGQAYLFQLILDKNYIVNNLTSCLMWLCLWV